MNRQALLDKGYTEEQVTQLLNDFHSDESKTKKLEEELEKAKKDSAKIKDYERIIEETEKEKMTKEELLKTKEEEIEKRYNEANLYLNKTKARGILIEAGIDEDLDEIVGNIVKTDEAETLKGANAIAKLFKSKIEATVKKTKEDMANLDVKPNPSNINDDGGKPAMNQATYDKLHMSEKAKMHKENKALWETFNK